MNQSQLGLADQKTKSKSRIFCPVTLKMLEEARPRPDDILEIDGEPINDVTFVGQVLKMSQENMRTIYHVTDNTGSFKVIFYQKDQNVRPYALKNLDYKVNMHVRIYG